MTAYHYHYEMNFMISSDLNDIALLTINQGLSLILTEIDRSISEKYLIVTPT